MSCAAINSRRALEGRGRWFSAPNSAMKRWRGWQHTLVGFGRSQR
jgi:hypothetical protein